MTGKAACKVIRSGWKKSNEEVVTRGDLLDRSLSVELEPIPDQSRRTEAEIEAEFRKVQPLILGALLDATAAAMRNISVTKLTSLPRMADFALWVTAAEPTLPWSTGDFLAAYSGNREQAHESILADSVIYAPLLALLDKRGGTWEGTASNFLDALAVEAGDKAVKQRAWPQKPNALMNRLNRLAPALRVAGITIERERQAQGKRIVRVEMYVKDRHPSSPSSPSSPPQNSCGLKGHDHAKEIVTSIVTPAAPGPVGDDPGNLGDDHGDDQKTAEKPQGDDGDDLLHTLHVSDLEEEGVI